LPDVTPPSADFETAFITKEIFLLDSAGGS